MSHHFDNPNAGDDPRLNVCDFYLFTSAPGRTVMAMTVNPDAGISAPDTLRDEGVYAFRFDLNGDAREEVTFKFRFNEPRHGAGAEHVHVQSFDVRRATGVHATQGIGGEIIARGDTGERVESGQVKAFVGLAPDVFAGDGAAILRFKKSFYEEGRYDPEAWTNHKDIFAKRNVTAIVLEVPTAMIGEGQVNAWATTSLYGHAPEVRVSRWGIPMFTHVFLPEKADLIAFNSGVPADDVARFGHQVAEVGRKMTQLTGSVADPSEYGRQLAAKLLPAVTRHRLGSQAAFDFAQQDGRALADDTMDVIITLMTNIALSDGVAPPRDRIRPEFPYFGAPFSAAEQKGLPPLAKRAADLAAYPM